jgi:precorrin-6B methylase 2
MFAHPVMTLKAFWALLVLLRGRSGYLKSTAWWESQVAMRPIDVQGNPIPWITYPSIRFLEPRLRSDMAVFEFGSGSSTLWWAKRVRRVVACEHDREWFDRVRSQVQSNNVELIHADRKDDAYSRQVLNYERQFDIVVIDGRDRVKCASNSLQALKPDGVIVWDNSDRGHYQPGFELLAQHGFRRVDFTGLTPLVVFECSTAIFYRDRNCLGL